MQFKWDAMPAGQSWTGVRVYEVVGTGYTQIAEAPAGVNTVTAQTPTSGLHKYVARSFVIVSGVTKESPDSAPAILDLIPLPSAPTSFTLIFG
jgi:hypothetical protein